LATGTFSTPYDIFRPEDLGEVVRELRHRRGWSQAVLAEWLAVSRPTVIKLERGIGSVDLVLRALLLLGAVPTVRLKGSGGGAS
jgi:transcriptional regulator with XRE-family HTH domain